jgi:hypothetical protein
MNKLIWKELREMRLIPVAIPLMVVVILLVCDAASNWMPAHGVGGLQPMGPNDTLLFLMLGLAGSGIFVGSVAIAPELGNGTLAFLTALPIGRPRVWTAKVIAGVITMAASAATVTLGWSITVLCLFHGRQPVQAASGVHDPIIANALTDTAVDWISRSAFHTAIVVTALIACSYCVSLLVSTLVDRTSTAAIVAVIASAAAGAGLFYSVNLLDSHQWIPGDGNIILVDEHDPHSLPAVVIAYALIVLGLLSASFVAFCQGDSLRTRRRLVIAAVVLLGWSTAGGLGFAAYGRHLQEGWQSIAIRRRQAWRADVAEYHTVTTVAAPAVHGQHWTIYIDHALIGAPYFQPVVIGIGTDDLDTPGAIPVKAKGGDGVYGYVARPTAYDLGPFEYYRSASKVMVVGEPGEMDWRGLPDEPADVTVLPSTSGTTAPRRIVQSPTVAKVQVYYWAKAPVGPERKTVRLYDTRGRIVGAIDVVIRSTAMFVDHCKTAPGGVCSD